MSKTNIPRNLQADVFRRDGFRCRYCGSTDGPFELDHVYPESHGGQTTLENLVVSCRGCNRLKNDNVGMWPFPIGYFETPENVPEGENRYWGHLLTAIQELDHTVSAYKESESSYVRLTDPILDDKDRDESGIFLAGQLVHLWNSISDIRTRVISVQRDLANIFPSRIKSFILMMTGQKPAMIDLRASRSALEKSIEETSYIIHDAYGLMRPFVEESNNSGPSALVLSLFYKPIEYLEYCEGSLNFAINMLHQAQLSIVPQKYDLNYNGVR